MALHDGELGSMGCRNGRLVVEFYTRVNVLLSGK